METSNQQPAQVLPGAYIDALNPDVAKHLYEYNVGLEKESLRVYEDGTFAKSEHPEVDNVVRDFCENQTEINTGVYDSARKAVDALYSIERQLQKQLFVRTPREYLWPFSNPPYIKNENDIPIAHFEGDEHTKEVYRHYLADKYGRYKMTFSGIHVNISFGNDLLRAAFEASDFTDYDEFVDLLYLEVTKKAVKYGWILVALTAASCILDSSYVEKGILGQSLFLGLSSVRNSELGYWNFFTPVFNYNSLPEYTESIQSYVDSGLIFQASELYYPVRLKPKGENKLENFKKGISHLELRMFDLNPLSEQGLDVRDVEFAHLFLLWLACTKPEHMSAEEQVYAAANFKNAAHFDLKTVRILNEKGKNVSMLSEGKSILEKMMSFYEQANNRVQSVLAYEYWKLLDASGRYAWKLKDILSTRYVYKGMDLAKYKQLAALEYRDASDALFQKK